MSTVYMCDNCGNLFSVNAPGWEQYTKHISRGDTTPRSGYGYPNMAEASQKISYDNAFNHGAATFHTCRTCIMGDGHVVTPRVSLVELPTGEITSDPKLVEIYEDTP